MVRTIALMMASCVRKLEYGMPLGDLPSGSAPVPASDVQVGRFAARRGVFIRSGVDKYIGGVRLQRRLVLGAQRLVQAKVFRQPRLDRFALGQQRARCVQADRRVKCLLDLIEQERRFLAG